MHRAMLAGSWLPAPRPAWGSRSPRNLRDPEMEKAPRPDQAIEPSTEERSRADHPGPDLAYDPFFPPRRRNSPSPLWPYEQPPAPAPDERLTLAPVRSGPSSRE